MADSKIILGIDPGTNLLGYGVIEIPAGKTQPVCLSLGIIRLGKFEDHAQKLKAIFDRISQLIDGFKVDEMSIEAPFYGKNVQSMLKLGRAQGVAIAAALNKDIPVFEYEPLKIKQSVTGRGNATKQQVAEMLKHTLNLIEAPETLDATDGLAAALCHFYQFTPQKFGVKKGKSGGWGQFIKDNPDKLR